MKVITIKKNDFTNYYNLKKGYAKCVVSKGWGYSVKIYSSDDELLDEYTAGDCIKDSQVYSTGQLSVEKLIGYAIQTAQEMLEDNDIDADISINIENDNLNPARKIYNIDGNIFVELDKTEEEEMKEYLQKWYDNGGRL